MALSPLDSSGLQQPIRFRHPVPLFILRQWCFINLLANWIFSPFITVSSQSTNKHWLTNNILKVRHRQARNLLASIISPICAWLATAAQEPSMPSELIGASFCLTKDAEMPFNDDAGDTSCNGSKTGKVGDIHMLTATVSSATIYQENDVVKPTCHSSMSQNTRTGKLDRSKKCIAWSVATTCNST